MTMEIVFISILALVTMVGMLWMAIDFGVVEYISVKNIIRMLFCSSAAIMSLMVLTATASIKL
nr:hypothetical protein [Clostridium sp. Marseille-P7770]